MTPPREPAAEPAFAAELENFQDIARAIVPSPGEIPRLDGLDIAGFTLPLRGVVGGDHVLYIDFNRRYDLDARIREARAEGRHDVVEKLERNRQRAGILLADVAGHRITDAAVAAMLHQAFLLGTYYELDRHGEITTQLFEHIKTRFFETSSVRRFFTMIYGEISIAGTFRFVSAGHPAPVVFSRQYGRIMRISEDRTLTVTPVGMFPSSVGVDARRNLPSYGYEERYTVNEINLLGTGDLLVLATDGLFDHAEGTYYPAAFERCLVDQADRPAHEVVHAIRAGLLAFAPPRDDVSVVVIKKV